MSKLKASTREAINEILRCATDHKVQQLLYAAHAEFESSRCDAPSLTCPAQMARYLRDLAESELAAREAKAAP